MNKLEHKLQEIKQSGKLGLMTHVVVGYPTLSDTIKLVKLMAKEGVDIVELQIPFSDPLADGPTIMKACEASLRNGTKVQNAFVIMQQLSKAVDVPLLFMAYYNTVFNYSSSRVGAHGVILGRSKATTPETDSGQARLAEALAKQARMTINSVEAFCRDAKNAGAAGLIVPDVPIEEEHSEHVIAMCKKYGLDNIRVVSPSSTGERLQKNAEVGTGFVYCTARQGITGARRDLNSDLLTYLRRVKKHFSIPIAVGFGISKSEHIHALKGYADIAIIGSAIIDVVDQSTPKTMESNVRSFLKSVID